MTEIPPNPDGWEQGSVALQRDDRGLLSGQICLAGARFWVRSWRKGGDKHHVLMECQPVSDPEFEAIAAALAGKAAG